MILLRQIRWEQRQFWRNLPAAVFTVAFPLIFLVLFASLFGDETLENRPGEPRFVQVYVPAIMAFGVISACYTAIAFTLTVRREQGILKRKRGTPLLLRDFLGGMIGSSLIVAALLSVITVVVGILVFDVTFPHPVQRLPALVVVVLLGAACFSALGVAVSGLISNEEAAPAVINVVLFPVLFISGTFAPVTPDSFIDRVARLFPVWHFNRACEWVFSEQAGGGAWRPRYLVVLAGWMVLGIVVAAARFRWEPTDASRGARRRRGRRRGRDVH